MKLYIKAAASLDPEQKAELAKIASDPKKLARLADDKNDWVRCSVAENPNTPMEDLLWLADDENVDVSRLATGNLPVT